MRKEEIPLYLPTQPFVPAARGVIPVGVRTFYNSLYVTVYAYAYLWCRPKGMYLI